MKVLGIDPGSRNLGFGLVSRTGNKLIHHKHGTLKFNTKLDSNERLYEIYQKIKELLVELNPDAVAIEKVFLAKNFVSALKLGQARGVVILAVMEKGLPLFEYSPNEVKQACVGFGHADKKQIAKMISLLLNVHEFETLDASDALAVAICHLEISRFKKNF
jgi:crossover junction endodeoxyribonuclease RuvC